MLGKIESGRKRGKTNMRYTDSIKKAMGTSVQEKNRAVGDKNHGHHLFSESPGVRANSATCSKHEK